MPEIKIRQVMLGKEIWFDAYVANPKPKDFWDKNVGCRATTAEKAREKVIDLFNKGILYD